MSSAAEQVEPIGAPESDGSGVRVKTDDRVARTVADLRSADGDLRWFLDEIGRRARGGSRYD